MSIITCIECNGMVSTMATICPHCGFPINQNNNKAARCLILGNEYDLQPVLDFAEQGDTPYTRLHGGAAIERITGLTGGDNGRLWKEIVKTKKIPEKFITKEEKELSGDYPVGIPRCPICKSTNLTKKSAAVRAIDGAFFGRLSVEGRSQFRCNNCRYEF